MNTALNTSLYSAVEDLIHRETGEQASIVGGRAASGGCINQAQVVELADGRCYFLKSNGAPLPGMFEEEARGLAALASAATLRVPQPVGTGGGIEGVPPFLVTEAIKTGVPGPRFFEDFGQGLAELHSAAPPHRGPENQGFGFPADNYLGATPQPNTWHHDWVEFWSCERLGHQLKLVRQKGLNDPTWDRLGDRLLDRLDDYLREPAEPAALLHGDLWGGNYMVDPSGAPVLIDPAAYCGRREADLAMTCLFGGFDARFYAAYEETWPLAPGSEERLAVYELYHLLNHLNLFGGSYRSGCLNILRRLA